MANPRDPRDAPPQPMLRVPDGVPFVSWDDVRFWEARRSHDDERLLMCPRCPKASRWTYVALLHAEMYRHGLPCLGGQALIPRAPDPGAGADLLTSLTHRIREVSAAHDAQVELLMACEHIAEGMEGWEVLRNACPSTAAVASLRDQFDSLVAWQKRAVEVLTESASIMKMRRSLLPPNQTTAILDEIAVLLKALCWTRRDPVVLTGTLRVDADSELAELARQGLALEGRVQMASTPGLEEDEGTCPKCCAPLGTCSCPRMP